MVKEKPNSTRIYDQDGFRLRAACICVKNDSESEVLLVSSSRKADQWIVPGGGVEPDESTSVAAKREVVEEAGVLGNIDRCLGVFENLERKHRTAVYVLVVTEELPDWEDGRNIGRKRKWFPLEEAMQVLSSQNQVHQNYLTHLKPWSNTNNGETASSSTNGSKEQEKT